MLSRILRLYKKDGGRSFPAPRSYRAAKNSGAGAIMLPPQAHVASRQTTSTHSRKIWMAMPPMRRMRCTEAINRGTSDYKPPGRGMTTIRTLGPGLSVDPSGELAKPTLRHPRLSALGGVGRAAQAPDAPKTKPYLPPPATFKISEDGIGRRGKGRQTFSPL